MLTSGILRRAQARRRGRGGFTVLELAIVAALSTLLMVLLLKWILALALASASGLDSRARTRDTTFVSAQLEADLAAATGCDAYGLVAPVERMGSRSFNLYSDVVNASGVPGSDGIADLVLWRTTAGTVATDDGTLQRAVIAGTGSCTYNMTSPDWRVLADAVDDDPAHRVFVGRASADGTAQPTAIDGTTTDCTGMAAESCLFGAMTVDLDFAGVGATRTAASLTDTLPINLAWSRL